MFERNRVPLAVGATLCGMLTCALSAADCALLFRVLGEGALGAVGNRFVD